MDIVGVVSEFNPFHNGHAYLLAELRKKHGNDAVIICVMSGDFVQRGEPAYVEKYTRAKVAAVCGADIVIELPVRWSLSSAENFAKGAIAQLQALHITHLGYGCESEDALQQLLIARYLASDEFIPSVKDYLRNHPNTPFAEARQAVVAGFFPEEAELLKSPNNNLAVEYLKAAIHLGCDITPSPVLRKGSLHDGPGVGAFRCASELRQSKSVAELKTYVPEQAFNAYLAAEAAGCFQINRSCLEIAILSRLKMQPEAVYQQLPDGANGAGNRLYEAVYASGALEDIYESAKTKRFAMARIRRMAMCAALGLSAAANVPPHYLRVLAFNAKGREYLRQVKENALLPVIIKPATIRDAGKEAVKEFQESSAAHDLFVLGYNNPELRQSGLDYKTGPFIL